MQRLSEIQAASVPPRETSVSLTTRSGKRLPPDSVKNLALLMAEAQAYFPNQSLPRGTPAVYLKAWEEIAMIFGIQKFTDALWKVLRESEAFFPMPLAIERKCREISKFEHSQKLIDGYRRDDEHRKANPDEYFYLPADPDFQAIRKKAVKRDDR